MEELVKETEKKPEKDTLLFWVKIQTCLTGVILILMLCVAGFTMVQANNMLKLFRGVELERINSIILTVQDVAAGLQDVDVKAVNKTVEALKGAAENLAGADIGAVNDGIQALTAAAENLQGLDIDQMNELIESLEKVSKEMEKTTSAFSRLFSR